MGQVLVTRRRSGRVAAVVALCGLALSGIAAASATGSAWTARQMPGSAGESMLFGISCPSASLCVAVGGNNSVASSTNPAGGAGNWSVAYAGEGSAGPNTNYRQIRGVSCPSPQLCVAVSFEGRIFTSTDPTGPGSSWTVADLTPTGPKIHFYGVSCPSPTFCAAVAGKGVVVTSTNPTGGAGAWAKTQLEGPLELRGVSCYSAVLCVAVGDDGDNIRPEPGDEGELVSSTNPLGGVWQRGQAPPGRGSLYGVSCPSPTFCVSGNALGDLVHSTSPALPGPWRATDAQATVQITDTDCFSPSRCVAVDNNSDVLTSTNPGGGPGDWTFTNILPYPGIEETQLNGTFGVSCPSINFCAIAGADGQIFTSTDPFVETQPTRKTTGKKQKKRHRKRPKRPRTTIARAPTNGLEIESKRVRVQTYFFARHRVQVRGFACGLDGRPLKRCRSPKSYRVGVGKHVIRVRAIGWTGLRGPAEVAQFEVCHPTFPPNCQGRPIR